MLPEWLTELYIQSKLRIYYKDNGLKVLKLWSKPASGKGDNWVGVMTRIHVEFQRSNEKAVQKETYLLKEGCSKDAPQAKLFIDYEVYTREMDMYEFILPKMSEILLEVGITDKMHANAICVDREHEVIILEDLAPLKYSNADRVKQLDLPHAELTIDMLAKFHAAATVLKQRHPESMPPKLLVNYFSRDREGYRRVFTGLYKALLRYVKSEPKLESRYYHKLERTLTNLMEYAARAHDVNEQDLQTLLHGDCWTTNIMFQYDNQGQPRSVVPIDFQFSVITSPVLDLHYFFSTSLQEDVRIRQLELVQRHYYALRQNLEKLKYKGNIPTLFEYQLEFQKRHFFAVFVSLVFQPFMVYQGEVLGEFVDFYENTPQAIKFQDSLYSTAKAHEIVAKMLPIFDAKGLLDDQ
ncbi:uncharacterized protein [Drosophila tropicalis]|uniref:uncharacterized protein n=1 Tax=Drosophila tropicalis TaxID=46794 RepID=UPI0035AC1246